jgi:2,3-bisphosphoglycerate-dependent phosphoglycerate mutase
MTEVYLIRHSEPIRDGVNYINVSDFQQELNEKGVLSVRGEKKARQLANQIKDIDYVISSSYARAVSTAKYFGYSNNKQVLVDERFGERKFGVKSFSELPPDFEKKQFEDYDYKLENGESINEVRTRMKEALDDVIDKYKDKRIVIVSHSTAMLSLLLNYIDSNSTETMFEIPKDTKTSLAVPLDGLLYTIEFEW